MKLSFHAILFILILLCCFSCSNDQTPGSIVKSYVDSIEEAAESRNARKVRSLIAKNYRDENKRTEKDISMVVSSYLLRNKSIHILKKISEVEQRSANSISAVILAAISGTQISDVSSLTGMNADIYWFEIVIVDEDGTWKLASASWRQALVSDFLHD